ncbi:DUF3574 domain-containing protein [Streptomyces sp. NPDC058001]|uniref:DUF3574 domain-containing protein n=1 Tax=Streptomyces sp. NPDC058001 TaxID=3346300 RepID=UPI0036ECE860
MRTLSARARLLTSTAALAVLAAGVPAAGAALDDRSTPSPTVQGAPSARGKAYIETRLFFGTERPDGGPAVTDRQFMGFIDTRVTPDFPEGLTVRDGRGQWRDAHGTIERERSYELVLLYPAAEARARDGRIERIRSAYQRLYGQESVARLDDATRADFG